MADFLVDECMKSKIRQGEALEVMRQDGRFAEMLFIVDTCQGGTLFTRFDSPGILAMGSR